MLSESPSNTFDINQNVQNYAWNDACDSKLFFSPGSYTIFYFIL